MSTAPKNAGGHKGTKTSIPGLIPIISLLRIQILKCTLHVKESNYREVLLYGLSEHYFVCLSCKVVELHDMLSLSGAKKGEIATDFLGERYRVFKHCGQPMEELSMFSVYCPNCER